MSQATAILGLGLIGSSLARAFKQRAAELTGRVIVYDRKPEVLRQALADGSADEAYQLDQMDSAGTDFTPLKDCGAVFICTPVAVIPRLAQAVAARTAALITDVGSVKAPLLTQLEGLRYIGGHPMAGSERVGYACGRASLFEDAIYVFCPPAGREQDPQVLADTAWLSALAAAIGASPLVLAAERHDEAVAAISHLPHVVASGLVNTAVGRQDDLRQRLAAGGFRDITRIASSDPELWSGICLQNRGPLLRQLAACIRQLDDFRHALTERDAEALSRYFAQARDSRDRLPDTDSRGSLQAEALLTAEISDRPGELGRLATLLGEAGISIRNMGIRHARPYEGGRLSVYLADPADLRRASALLRQAGYDCE
ncbi:prephenate dehydrogenase [Oscillospiraceae bacterium HV4-5-C5C]|nr:prephenate dehydrogenase [Oscillospiraceae bacterium HV4-5-C5C]